MKLLPSLFSSTVVTPATSGRHRLAASLHISINASTHRRLLGASGNPDPLEVEFIFRPSAEADDYYLNPPHPWRNPNRPGTLRHFWHEVRDVLRHLTFTGRRGSYLAPGPHGRRNNIVRQPLPHGAGDPPVLHGGGIAHLPGRTPHLDTPPFPLTDPPVALTPLPLPPPHYPTPPMHPRHPAVASRPPFVFRGQAIGSAIPFRYSQEVLFVGDSDEFINRPAALAAMRDVVNIMHKHRTVHVTILGNAASNLRLPEWPFGSNKAALMRAPSHAPGFPTVGKLMQARARAIANLITSQGVSHTRVHYDVGRFEYDKDFVGAARRRRATIVIEDRR